MNVLEIVRDARPEVGPLDPVHREALRRHLLGSVAPPHATTAGLPVESGRASDASGQLQSRWLAAAAAALVAATLGAIMIVADRRTPVTSDTPDASSVAAGPLADAPYTPLALAEPPAGYHLVSAKWGTGPGRGGSAVYVKVDSGDRLEVVSTQRNGSQPTVTEPDQLTWLVADFTVTAASTTGCSRYRCEVGLQWDANTFATLTWSGPDGGELEPTATIDALLDLIPRLTPATSVRAVVDLIAGTSTTSPVTPVPLTTTPTQPTDMTFTPVVLTTPPDGFALASTRYYPGDGGFGIARYRHPDHRTQLEVTSRGWELPVDTLTGLGRTPGPTIGLWTSRRQDRRLERLGSSSNPFEERGMTTGRSVPSISSWRFLQVWRC